jgi:hypothetical protein
VKDGTIPIEGLSPDKRLYKVPAVFGNGGGMMFMLIGEHAGAFAIFEASQYTSRVFTAGIPLWKEH